MKQTKKHIALKKILIIVFAFIVLSRIYHQCKAQIYLNNSDTIVRISFFGLEYMFHQPYEYYALGLKSSCKIPVSMIEEKYGDKMEEQTCKFQDFEEWSIDLDYVLQQENDYADGIIRTPYGNDYRLSYGFWNPSQKRLLTLEEQQKILQITKLLYNSKITNNNKSPNRNFAVYETGHNILRYKIFHKDDLWYIVYTSGNLNDILMRLSEDDSLVKLLELSKGDVDAFYFLLK